MLTSENLGQLEKEAREQGAGSKGDRAERGFDTSTQLLERLRRKRSLAPGFMAELRAMQSYVACFVSFP